jgi:hypothetical protein
MAELMDFEFHPRDCQRIVDVSDLLACRIVRADSDCISVPKIGLGQELCPLERGRAQLRLPIYFYDEHSVPWRH